MVHLSALNAEITIELMMTKDQILNIKRGDIVEFLEPYWKSNTGIVISNNEKLDGLLVEIEGSPNTAQDYVSSSLIVLDEDLKRCCRFVGYASVKDIIKQKTSSKKPPSFGRWLSGIDQYNDENYIRDKNSWSEWL